MTRHHARRTPKPGTRFSWGRVVNDASGTVSYRLFRRDCAGKVHMGMLSFAASESRSKIAHDVRRYRNTLRDRVDALDLESLGLAA